MDEAAAILDKHPATNLERVKEALKEGMHLIDERQKLIKIADCSESGWLTAQEYETDQIADDSDDEKRYTRAKRQAERLKRRRVRVLGDVVEEVGFFVPNRIDSLIRLPQQEFSTGQSPSRGLAFNLLQWGLQDWQALSSASCADVLDTFGENVRCSDWQEGWSSQWRRSWPGWKVMR